MPQLAHVAPHACTYTYKGCKPCLGGKLTNLLAPAHGHARTTSARKCVSLASDVPLLRPQSIDLAGRSWSCGRLMETAYRRVYEASRMSNRPEKQLGWMIG